MNAQHLIIGLLVGGGLAAVVVGILQRAYAKDRALAEILDLPYGEFDVDVSAAVAQHSVLADNLTGIAAKAVDQFDAKGALLGRLERARVPVRPGEFVVITICGGIAAAAVAMALTGTWLFGLVMLLLAPLVARAVLDNLIAKRQKAFEEAFPDALSLIASSLSGGHTFLRAIQMMVTETEGPLAEEFGRVVNETQLGDPLIDALDRMASRVGVKDLEWVVQAIRIQQTVGGRLAELLHTLADFVRAREELRREVKVLTAEGRASAWVLGALPPMLGLIIMIINPGYLDPMFRGWGPVWLAGSAASVGLGVTMINKMVKFDV